MENRLFSFQDITVQHQARVLFNKLSFEVRKGECWALLGPAGAGKSALLDTIAGHFWISSGQAVYPLPEQLVQEFKVKDPLFSRQQLVAQLDARHSFRTLTNTTEFYYQQRYHAADVENVATVDAYLSSIKAYAVSPVWTRDKVIERLRLGKLLEKRLIMLSNGEIKRLILAAALLKNPLLLLLDSPLAGLDVAAREDFNKLLQEISWSGIAVIMTTAPPEIPDAITHIAVLEAGEMLRRQSIAAFKEEGYQMPLTQPVDLTELQALSSENALSHFENIIDMHEVVVKWGEKVVLDGISWQVKQGERWALLGHNGAGKSTLLSLISADNPQAYANNIKLFDKSRGKGESIWEIKKKIGFVSQELFQYFPEGNNCLQLIESGFYDTLGLLKPSIPANSRIAIRWMKLLGIESYAAQHFKRAPTSIQRLCLLARALVKNPELLILDEPCQGLDGHQQLQFKQLVELLCNQSPITLIYVSHYKEELPACITHTLRLAQGRIASAEAAEK